MKKPAHRMHLLAGALAAGLVFLAFAHPARSATPTTLTLGAVVNAVSGNVTLSALVDACAPLGALPEFGTIQFFEGTTLVATYTLGFAPAPFVPVPCPGGFVRPNATLPGIALPAVAPGPHSYTATYSGDALYAPSAAAAVDIVVPPRQPVATTLTLDGGVDPVTHNVRLAAIVSACAPSGAPLVSGTIQFYDVNTLVGSAPLVPFPGPPPGAITPCSAGFVVSNLTLPGLYLLSVISGAHAFTAAYGGDSTYLPSTSATLALTVPAGPPALPVPALSEWVTRIVVVLLAAAAFVELRPHRGAARR